MALQIQHIFMKISAKRGTITTPCLRYMGMEPAFVHSVAALGGELGTGDLHKVKMLTRSTRNPTIGKLCGYFSRLRVLVEIQLSIDIF